ncbi:hypothetical protein M408DRAFT_64566 [Serendipita vermifera MAFF 305830]|uniref:Uncharacterized protein n=1 Tax=Serendipita vermifera MAFF 305830 TaxID=933852 RepID=A0A0C3BH99_SERVB|nr:hypothetical protein M408DRAFT_64566 [Serendipita vermifera MAFF 305830]
MATSPRPVSVALFNDASSDLQSAGANYPSSMVNGHLGGQRRAISGPPMSLPPPSARQPVIDSRSTIQRFAHRTVEEGDKKVLNGLIALHSAELASLDGQLLEADHLLAAANKRVAEVTGSDEEPSAQVVRDSIIQSRRGTQERIREVRRLLRSHRGLLHPVRKLPVEILAMIMKCAVDQEESDRRNALCFSDSSRRLRSPPIRVNSIDDASNPNDSPSTRLFPTQPLPVVVLLSHVCSYWRRTAHNTPALWRTIHFRLSGQPDVGWHSWNMVRWFMEKARHNPDASEQQPGRMGLVFTGWVEHEHPKPNHTLQKVLRMLADNEGGKAPGTTIHVSEGPGHSRRYSDAPSTIELSLTPDSESDETPGDAIIVPGMQVIEGPPPEVVPTFRLGRLEIDFHTLCEHDLLVGQHSNAQLHWHSSCPKPEEVVFIAHDSVYRAPHGHDPAVGLLSPPYSKTLIPSAKEVTLCNLSFDWAPNLRARDSYSKLTSLKLVYTHHFDRLLQKPENMDNMGFLQFLRVAHNLIDLEIRLAAVPPVSFAVPGPTPLAVAAAQAHGAPPISIPVALQRLTVSLPDLCRLIPLFLPESSRPSAPSIYLPSLTHLSILPSDARARAEPSSTEPNAQLIHQFLQMTEATVTHLEFLQSQSSEPVIHDLTSSASTAGPSRPLSHAREDVAFVLQQFSSCQSVDVWGDENARSVISSFRIAPTPSIAIVSEADAPSGWQPSARTSSSLRPVETAVSRVQSEALRSHLGSYPSSAAQSSENNSFSSPMNKPTKRLTKPSKKASTATVKPQKRISVLSTPKDIIAKVLAPFSSKRHSLAIVESPVGTPTMVLRDLPTTEAPVDMEEIHDPELLSAPSTSMRSSLSHPDSRMHVRVASSSRVDSASGRGDEGLRRTSSASREIHSSSGVSEDVIVFPSVKRITFHDTLSVTPLTIKSFASRGIDAAHHG